MSRLAQASRLDRMSKAACRVAGVLLFALDKQTAGLAQQVFELRKVVKTYHAIVCGISPQEWLCETPLRKNPEDESLPARTSFERLMVTSETPFPADPTLSLSLLKATPTTGRFHQIRRHLLEAGIPIVGDFRYAGQDRSYALGAILGIGTRMLLQAKLLEFLHPRTAEPMRIEAPTDADFRKCFPGLA